MHDGLSQSDSAITGTNFMTDVPRAYGTPVGLSFPTEAPIIALIYFTMPRHACGRCDSER